MRTNIYVLTRYEGGTGRTITHLGQQMIFSRTFDCMAACLYQDEKNKIMPGENGVVDLVFRVPMVIGKS